MDQGRGRFVSRDDFDEVLSWLKGCKRLSLDTETFGLRPYHGDKLFSIIIGRSPVEAFYFNFQPYSGLPPQHLLNQTHLTRLRDEVFSRPEILWFIHRAKYDMAILAQDGIKLAGEVHCTMAQARVEYNDRFRFNLDQLAGEIGFKKDPGVEAWIDENKAFEYVVKRGKKIDVKNKFFWKVPVDIIVPYGLEDARVGFALGEYQVGKISDMGPVEEGGPSVWNVMLNERRLTKTVFNMERVGCLVDLPYSARAADFEARRRDALKAEFKQLTGFEFKDSPKLFEQVFLSDRERWVATEKGNWSFDGDVLPTFLNPAAQLVIDIRDCKAKSDFYTGFAHHADSQGRVHSNFNQGGANHGRFSSSGPNFQNLSNEEDDAPKLEYVVRRAIIPTPGSFLCAIDYKTMEYRFMLEYACRFMGYLTPLAKRIIGGEDFHQATADLATATTGSAVKRSQAKTTNFLNLYGGGTPKLAGQLKIKTDEAWAIKNAINQAAPEIRFLQQAIMETARVRGYIVNWLGRRCHFPDPRFAYQAPNHLIAGGCADVMKVAMNQIDDLLASYRSRMVLNIHDELVFEIFYGEEHLIPKIKHIMENAFPAKYVPLECSVYTSTASLADLQEWKEVA